MLPTAVLGLVVAVTPTAAADIEPEADRILRSMTEYVAGLKSFAADIDVEDEVINADGLKLQYSATGKIAVERPGKLHFTRRGPFADIELTFDGTTISVMGKKANIYGQIESPGPTIDEAVEELRATTGLDISGADLFAADAYAALTYNVTEGIHVGTGIVGGVESEHLAFRGPEVDWQIWIQKGDQPLPLKYVITTKWVTGAPQHVLRMRNWDVAPQLDAQLFAFEAPSGARKLESFSADLTGEFFEEILQ